jgi:hypothetical protein
LLNIYVRKMLANISEIYMKLLQKKIIEMLNIVVVA